MNMFRNYRIFGSLNDKLIQIKRFVPHINNLLYHKTLINNFLVKCHHRQVFHRKHLELRSSVWLSLDLTILMDRVYLIWIAFNFILSKLLAFFSKPRSSNFFGLSSIYIINVKWVQKNFNKYWTLFNKLAYVLNPFLPNLPFLTRKTFPMFPLKCFQGNQKGTFGRKVLIKVADNKNGKVLNRTKYVLIETLQTYFNQSYQNQYLLYF